jgi:hypothetical protein
MSGLMADFSVSNFRVPSGTYIAMDAATHTYLNVLNFEGPGGSVVCSVGNQLGNDIVSSSIEMTRTGNPNLYLYSGTSWLPKPAT